MIINHNMTALNALRNLNTNGALQASASTKLSSGLRINKAADDAAGLAISQSMEAQVQGLDQATRNAQDATSLIQTADGALNETQSILIRMRDLAVQASNSTYTDNDRQSMQAEVDQLKSEIDRIGNTTAFNNKTLLDGSASAFTSSSDANTKIFMRGGLTENGISAAGTYQVDVTLANSGVAQVQASGIMTVTGTNTVADGKTASGNTQLKNVAQFYDASGKFMLDKQQTITLVQGDGKTASFTIAGDDTLAEVAAKFQNAIGSNTVGLGQASVENVTQTQLATYTSGGGTTTGAMAISGTFILSSAVAGTDGQIHVIANSDLTRAFGFSDSTKAKNAVYNVTVDNLTDATMPNVTAKVEGNDLLGLVHKNVDLQIGSSSGQQANYDDDSGIFQVTASTTAATSTTYVHLADNTQTFQIGANELQNMGAAIGDMRAAALGVDKVVITDAASATKAITTLDAANSRVSSQRAALGAYQNRLAHTVTNLGVSQENLTASESQIKDVDMASEMVNYSKLSILSQTANAMLAQANQTPQQVLQLLQ